MSKAIAVISVILFSVVLSANFDVVVENFGFSPKGLHISLGDTVTFANRDSVAHTATTYACGGSKVFSGPFDLNLPPGASAVFNSSGVANATLCYFCRPHPNMVGEIFFFPKPGNSSATGEDTNSAAALGALVGSVF